MGSEMFEIVTPLTSLSFASYLAKTTARRVHKISIVCNNEYCGFYIEEVYCSNELSIEMIYKNIFVMVKFISNVCMS